MEHHLREAMRDVKLVVAQRDQQVGSVTEKIEALKTAITFKYSLRSWVIFTARGCSSNTSQYVVLQGTHYAFCKTFQHVSTDCQYTMASSLSPLTNKPTPSCPAKKR